MVDKPGAIEARPGGRMRPALRGVSVAGAITLSLPLTLDSGQQTTYVFFTLYVIIVVGLSLLTGFAG